MQRLLRMMHKKEEGFTLVELMVVVVILGILVAIGMAMFGDVADDAAINANDANLRTIDGTIHVFRAGENSYPADIAALVSEGYLQEIPDCPDTDDTEAYAITDGGTSDARAVYTGSSTLFD